MFNFKSSQAEDIDKCFFRRSTGFESANPTVLDIHVLYNISPENGQPNQAKHKCMVLCKSFSKKKIKDKNKTRNPLTKL